MRVILNPLMPNKDGYLTPVKPSQVYHCDNINQFVTQAVEAGSLNAELLIRRKKNACTRRTDVKKE